MKKTILVLSFTVFFVSLFSQETLSWENRKLPEGDSTISVDAKQDEAEVRIYSPLPLTFQSITKVKDKNADPFKVEKEGPSTVYYFLFSSLSMYSDRKIRISSQGYRSIEIPLQLVAYKIMGFTVWDKEKEPFKVLVKEGNRLFEEGNYDQAKSKYLNARDRLEPEDWENEDAIIVYLDKVASCVDAKEKADKMYNEKKWLEAIKEYRQVIAINPADQFCRERISACTKEYENTPRIIKGTVTDGNGKGLAELNIAPLEDGKPGIRTITDSSGAYQIRTVNKTTELIYWEDGKRQQSIKLTGDVMNFVVK